MHSSIQHEVRKPDVPLRDVVEEKRAARLGHHGYTHRSSAGTMRDIRGPPFDR